MKNEETLSKPHHWISKLVLPCLGFLLVSCGGDTTSKLADKLTYKVDVPPPAAIPSGKYEFPNTELSNIAVTLDIPVSALAEKAKSSVPKDISGNERQNFHKRIKNGQAQYRIVPGLISLKSDGTKLGYSLPFQGAAAMAGEIDARILQIPVQGSADITGTIYGTSTPSINQQWKVLPNLTGSLQVTQAELTMRRLGTINAVNMVQQLAEPMIQKEIAKFANGIDVKPDVQKLWDIAHLNHQLSEEPASWLIIDPSAVSMSPINFSNPQTVSLTLGVKARTFVSSIPGNTTYPEPVPDLSLTQTAPTNQIRLPIIADLKEINKALFDQSFSESALGASVEVTKPELRVGQEGFVVVGFHVDADSGKIGGKMIGKIWMQAKPKLDFETQVISFEEVGFTEETREKLPNTAVSMLEKQIISTLEEELKVDLKKYLPDLEQLALAQLTSLKVPEGYQLLPTKPTIRLQDVYTVTRTSESAQLDPAIVLVVGGTGNLTVRISKL